MRREKFLEMGVRIAPQIIELGEFQGMMISEGKRA
jgi:hypothetical protein